MNRTFRTLGIVGVLAVGVMAPVRAAGQPAALSVTAIDEATQKKLDQKAGRIVDQLKLDDATKAAKVKAIASDWLGTMLAWHKEHDAELGKLWGEWNESRAGIGEHLTHLGGVALGRQRSIQ